MAVSKAQQKAVQKYMTKAYDAITLRVPKGQRDIIQAHAENMGDSVNSFLQRAIKTQIELDQTAPK